MSDKRNARLKDQQKRDEVTRRTVIESLMQHREGRRYIWLQLSDASVFAQTFATGPDGTLITAFKEGQRALGLKLLADVTRWAPQGYMTMTQENTRVELESENERSTDSPDPDA